MVRRISASMESRQRLTGGGVILIAVYGFQARGARRNCDSSMFPVGKLGMYPDFGVELLLLRAGESRRVPLTNDRSDVRMLDMELDISRVKIEESTSSAQS